MDHPQTLPSLSFDTANYAARDRADAVMELMSNTFGINVVNLGDRDVFAKVDVFDLGRACLGKYSYGEIEFRASAGRSPLGSQELLVLGTHQAGCDVGQIGDVGVNMQPDRLTLYDTSRPHELKSTSPVYLKYNVSLFGNRL